MTSLAINMPSTNRTPPYPASPPYRRMDQCLENNRTKKQIKHKPKNHSRGDIPPPAGYKHHTFACSFVVPSIYISPSLLLTLLNSSSSIVLNAGGRKSVDRPSIPFSGTKIDERCSVKDTDGKLLSTSAGERGKHEEGGVRGRCYFCVGLCVCWIVCMLDCVC